MSNISERLEQTEELLISAFLNDKIEDFLQFWMNLSKDILVAIRYKQLPAHLHTVASTTSDFVQSFLKHSMELQGDYDKLAEEFVQEVADLVDDKPGQRRVSGADGIPLPPYIDPAYQWLLDNIHSPYPSAALRNDLARRSGTSRKTIDAWFVDVRKRIGWGSLRRKRFSGKKEAIVKAATLFFKKKQLVDPALSLSFANIHSAAQDLYREKLQPSVLVTQFESAVGALSKPNGRQEASLIYPSPRSRSPSLPAISVGHLTSPTKVGQKRRRNAEGEDSHKISELSGRATKRKCLSRPTQAPLPKTCNSSEVCSLFPESTALAEKLASQCETRISERVAENRPLNIIPDMPLSSTLHQRKRRQSDSHHLPKTPSRHNRINRLQTVSTPTLRVPREHEMAGVASLDNYDCSFEVYEENPTLQISASTASTSTGAETQDIPSLSNFSPLNLDFSETDTCDQPSDIHPLDFCFYDAATGFSLLETVHTNVSHEPSQQIDPFWDISTNDPSNIFPESLSSETVDHSILDRLCDNLGIDINPLLNWENGALSTPLAEPGLFSLDLFAQDIGNMAEFPISVNDNPKASEIATLKRAQGNIAQRIYFLEHSDSA